MYLFLSSNTSASFAEPLSKLWTARFTTRYDYLKDEQDIGIYDKDILSSKYELINYAQSSGFEREQKRFNFYGGLSYKIKQVTLTAGISTLWQNIDNEFKDIPNPVKFKLFNVLPSFSLQWKQLSGHYNMNVNAPQSNFLVPVPDSTNPFMIRVGNPYLKPNRQHQFYFSNLQLTVACYN